MLVGAAEIYLNHRVIRIGSVEPPDSIVALQGSAFVATQRHLHLAARAQVGLVRLMMWKEASPVEGVTLFHDTLNLDGGIICVSDILGTSSFKYATGIPGNRALLVSVDDPGKASRIDIVLDPATREVPLTACRGYPIPTFRVAEPSSLDSTDELGFILSSHNIPINRLAAALKLIRSATESEEVARRSVMMEFRIRMIKEWLRWISPTLSDEQASSIASFILGKIQGASPADVDSFSIDISREVMRRALAG